MNTLLLFRTECLNAIKEQSASQSTQFQDLCKELKKLSTLTASLKAENTELRKEIIDLRPKFTTLESVCSPESTSTVIAQVLQEFFERERCQTNAIIYGIPDSLYTFLCNKEFVMIS